MIDSPRHSSVDRAIEFLDRYRSPLAVVAAALRTPADLVLHPLVVLPAMVVAVDGTALAASVLAAATTIAWLLPQLVVSRADQRHWLLAGRAGAAAILTVALLLLGAGGSALVAALILGSLFWALGGLLAAGDPDGVLMVPAEHVTHAPLGTLVGGALAVLTGLLVARWLAPDTTSFPGWAAQLAGLATVALLIATICAWRDRPVMPPAPPPWADLPLTPALLAHGRRPRRYLAFRATQALAALADPLVIVAGLRMFDLTWAGVGLVLAVLALVRLVADLWFRPLIIAGYARLLAQLAALARVLVPVLALSLPAIFQATPVASRLPVSGDALAPASFLLVIVLFSLALAATSATDTAYLGEAMAPSHRPAMRALLVIMLAVGSGAYLIGGQVADRWGVAALWLTAAGLGLVGLLASGLLLDVPPAETRDLTDTGVLPTYREQ